MAMLERLGYWVLVLFSVEVLVLFGLLWKRTGILFFKRWLYRLSWILPLHLWLAYLIYDTSLDPRAIRSFLDYNHFMARLLVRDTEILLARFIPHLTATIAVLSALPAIPPSVSAQGGPARTRAALSSN